MFCDTILSWGNTLQHTLYSSTVHKDLLLYKYVNETTNVVYARTMYDTRYVLGYKATLPVSSKFN